jgi:hypothetical protein
MCDQLKISMQMAIDQFNKELENENHPQIGEANVKRIAKMFKEIHMQEEGMKFYTNFIMLGKSNVG